MLTPRAFCDPCRSRIIACLEELPVAWIKLAVRIGDPVRAGKAVRVPPGSRVPLNPEIDALMRTMAAILGGWAARVRSVPGLQLADPDWPPDSAEAVKNACIDVMATHATPLLALQTGWTTRTYARPLDPAAEELIADEEIVRIGEHYVTVLTLRSGAHAGNEILDLHWRARKLLGETKPPPESFDGIPCRSCEAMTLERAEPPSDPALPAMHSRCPECRDEMDRDTFAQWADTYAQWARGAGIRECRRCALGNHGYCCWDQCTCAAAGHRDAAA